MDIQAIIQAIADALAANPAATISVTASTLAVGDFVSGAGAAFRAGTFKLEMVGQWVGTHLLGRVMPIAGVAFLGTITPALLAVAGLALGTYTAETILSIRKNLLVKEDA